MTTIAAARAPEWAPGQLTIDGQVTVPGEWRTDLRWNGWLCPRLRHDATEEVLAWVADSLAHDDPDATIVAVSDDGATYYLWERSYETDPGYTPETLTATPDGWYSPGHAAWCWSEARPALPDHSDHPAA